MGEVKRWRIEPYGDMAYPDVAGEWVKHDDYAALLARAEEAEASMLSLWRFLTGDDAKAIPEGKRPCGYAIVTIRHLRDCQDIGGAPKCDECVACLKAERDRLAGVVAELQAKATQLAMFAGDMIVEKALSRRAAAEAAKGGGQGMSVQAKYDDAATNVTRMVQADGVSARVAAWLETGDGYPEAFSVDEMEAIYAFARLGRWAWFREMQDHTSSGAPMFDEGVGRG